MYAYLKGKITAIKPTYIVLDINNIGYKVFSPNPYSFTENQDYIIYIYHHIREDEQSFYGFKTLVEKDLFLKLIEVKRLGPKIALPIIAAGSVDGIIDAIERENIIYLQKFPKISEKLARQIILDLKGKLDYKGEKIITVDNEELIEALKGLGYKNQDINRVIVNINVNNSIEDQLKEALKLLLK